MNLEDFPTLGGASHLPDCLISTFIVLSKYEHKKGIMKTIFAILTLAAASLAVTAQEPTPKPAEIPVAVEKKEPVSTIIEPMAICDLKAQNSPIVNGFQIGMPEREASLKLLATPFEKDPADPTHRKRISVKLVPDPIFENVDAAALTSYDEKVTSIRLTYMRKWPTVQEFVQNFAPKLGLVRIAFRIDTVRNEAKITCKDFTVDLRAGDTNSELTITDTRDLQKSAGPKSQ
jgi:hypothetical protein